ncbi:MAG: CopG family antitoxin [Bryobacteraceae bacterium]|nr:CopG family antitoxin [Bryobacteraceae bacterium]
MEKRRTTPRSVPKFASEQEEAQWWASPEGRKFLKEHSAHRVQKPSSGSKLVAKVAKANTVQIALRLPSPDLAKAREIAERKGIGYQTLIKMIVHEGSNGRGGKVEPMSGTAGDCAAVGLETRQV